MFGQPTDEASIHVVHFPYLYDLSPRVAVCLGRDSRRTIGDIAGLVSDITQITLSELLKIADGIGLCRCAP